MAKQYDFGRNQILRPEFLNSLQDVLQRYLDNFLLESLADTVRLVGTTTSPFNITIDGRMRTIPVTLVDQVVGPAGTYHVFVSVRQESITLDVVPFNTLPTGGDLIGFRLVGECTFDGTVVTGYTTYAVRTNADFLGGRSTSYPNVKWAVPYTGSDGRLHPGWFPKILEEKQEPLGTIRRMWYASNAMFTVPTGWAFMNGQTLLPGQHSFPGVGAITLPDMRNRVALGADPAKVHGTAPAPLNNAASAPGFGGLGGDNTERSFAHDHTYTGHTHNAHAHGHTIPSHRHAVPPHVHRHAAAEQWHDTVPKEISEWRVNYGITDSASGGLTTFEDGDTSSGAVPMSNPGGGTTDPALAGNIDVRPAHVGLVYLLRVHWGWPV